MSASLQPTPGPGPSVVVLEDEYEALADLVCASPRATPGIALLWRELERATVTPPEHAPDDLVRIGSRAYFTDLTRRESRMVRLVWPEDALAPVLVSVTSQVGAALLGLRAGAEFEWNGPGDGPRRLRVDHVEPPPPSRTAARRRRAG